MRTNFYTDRLATVRRRIQDAALRSGRDPASIGLVAVSKLHPAVALEATTRAGQLVFGESYIQEARRKQADLAHIPGVAWHFVGHLQRNKAKEAAGRFSLIHTLDSEELALALQRILERDAAGRAPCQDVLIQVNIGKEAQKSGIPLKDLPQLAEKVFALSRLRLLGLMCIPPFFDEPERARPYFAGLRAAQDDLRQRLGREMPHLSMGMSGDLEAAIEEGATLVRVGTDIFGPRPAARPERL